MRQRCRDAGGSVRRQPREDVLQMGMRVVGVELSGAYQAHDGESRWPARSEPANNQLALPMAPGRIWFSTQLCRLPGYAAS